MKALSLLVQKLWPRLSFFPKVDQKSRSWSGSQKFWYRQKGLVTRNTLFVIKVLSPFIKMLWLRLSLLWTDGRIDSKRQGDSYIPPQTSFNPLTPIDAF